MVVVAEYYGDQTDLHKRVEPLLRVLYGLNDSLIELLVLGHLLDYLVAHLCRERHSFPI